MTLRTHTRLVAIVGRPNVGKSTLFNRIAKKRRSLVWDEPGVTRDRLFARAQHENTRFFLCDTGGFEPASADNIKKQLVEQAELAIQEAESVIFVVDGREGVHPVDADLLKRIRKSGKHFVVAVNKCDTVGEDWRAEDFRKLGTDALFPVSAEHALGVGKILDAALEPFQNQGNELNTLDDKSIKLAIVGRPNVGKSSILNRLTGEKRTIVDSRPGTTRDAIDVETRFNGRDIVLVDTAGIRRKSRMVDRIEKYSALRSITSIEEAHVAALVIDAKEGPTEGDARVAGYAFELRKPIMIIVNKWDLIQDKDSKTADRYLEQVRMALRYIPYAPVLFVSALENLRVSKILPYSVSLYEEGARRISTGEVNRVLRNIVDNHTPPMAKNRAHRIKLFYATQVSVLPPRFVIFCTNPQDVHFSYRRFIENEFRKAFEYKDIPIFVHFRERARTAPEEWNEQAPEEQSAAHKRLQQWMEDDEVDEEPIDIQEGTEDREIKFDDEE